MAGGDIPREISRELGRQFRGGARAAGSAIDGWGERGTLWEFWGGLLGLGMKKRKRPGRRPPEEVHGSQTRWLCMGCGLGGQGKDEHAARGDADLHAAQHGFEHRYAMENVRY